MTLSHLDQYLSPLVGADSGALALHVAVAEDVLRHHRHALEVPGTKQEPAERGPSTPPPEGPETELICKETL